MKILLLKKFLSLRISNNNSKSKLYLYLNNFSVFITILSIIFIVLIISVNDGFKSTVNSTLIDLNGKYKIYNKYNKSLTEDDFDNIISYLPNKTPISKISTKNIIIKNRNLSEPINIIAFSNYETFINKIEDRLISGEMSNDKILIGQILADKLNVKIGSQLTFINIDSSIIEGIEVLTVGGVFNTNIPSYDRYLVYGNRQLFKNFIDNDYDYFLTNHNINNDLLNSKYGISNIFELNSKLFNWLNSYDTPIKMLVVFILTICIFNILQNNFLYITDKTKHLYLLKTLGLNNLYIYIIIILRSFSILSISCIIGFFISYSLLIIERNINFIKLPEYVYFTNVLPIDINYLLPFYIFPLLLFILITISIYFYYTFIRRYEF